jgi:hypothetical protein
LKPNLIWILKNLKQNNASRRVIQTILKGCHPDPPAGGEGTTKARFTRMFRKTTFFLGIQNGLACVGFSLRSK